MEELQKRSYLAKYLIRIPVPNEFLADPEVEALNIQAEELMEQFKVHIPLRVVPPTLIQPDLTSTDC